MYCENCQSPLAYGAKYCNTCGEKVPHGVFDAAYGKTVWAKLDKVKDGYDTFFLKKITGSVAFKIVSLLAVLVYFFFSMYGNLTGIRLKENDAYTITQNKTTDEYYIYPTQAEANLELFVPVGTDTILFTAMKDEIMAEKKEFSPEQYKAEGYAVSAGEYDFVEITALRKGKTADTVKIVVAEKIEVTK